GIRDFHVTGVQTCALPILWKKIIASLFIIIGIFSFSSTGYGANMNTSSVQVARRTDRNRYQVTLPSEDAIATDKKTALISGKARSEERREGKSVGVGGPHG